MITLLNNKKNLKIFSIIILATMFLSIISISLAAQNETEKTDSFEEIEQKTTTENITGEIISPTNISNETLDSDITEITENQSDILSEEKIETSQTSEQPENISAPTEEKDSPKSQILKPELEIKAFLPEKIIRGNSFEMKIEIKNLGNADAEFVTLQIILPEGFDSVEKENIETISVGETITLTKEISNSLSTSLGLNEIKLILSHKNA